MASNNRIDLSVNPYAHRVEGAAASTITPGMLLYLDSSNEWVVHPNIDGRATRTFALYNEWEGKTIDDTYAIGERVNVLYALSGDIIWAWLASGESVVISSWLSSNGDGTLKQATAPPNNDSVLIGRALEVYTAPASDVRIKVQIV